MVHIVGVTTRPTAPPHENRLAAEKSPYLLQHSRNPVDWYPWGDEAFAKARAEEKPIFLSVGYATCHWCHVMERESFEDAEVAGVLNAGFVSVKVDREERPDIDKIYMKAAAALGVRGGWPLSVWLTPELEPFYAGTYFPPHGGRGIPGLIPVLQRIVSLWNAERSRVVEQARTISLYLAQLGDGRAQDGGVPELGCLEDAAREIMAGYDPRHGGFGGAPKFPRPAALSFLLRRSWRSGDATPARMVVHTLERMACGGIYDQIGGGFSRYSVDEQWLVPHFEKMLYDNAQLLGVLADAARWLRSREVAGPLALFAEVARDSFGYLARDMASPEGAFYSAEDADSEGREGAFYVWAPEQLQAALSPDEAEFAAVLLGVTDAGNFSDHSYPGYQPGSQNVLSIAAPVEEAAVAAGFPASGAAAAWREIRAKLFAARSLRPRPLRDDKILAAWNGMAIGALASAGTAFDAPDMIRAAERAAEFVLGAMRRKDSRLVHSWRAGASAAPDTVDDYAAVGSGLIELHRATLDDRWVAEAAGLADTMLERFHDSDGGGFFISADDTPVPVRIQEDYDGAEPSGNSAAAHLLIALWRITGLARYREAAEGVLRCFREAIEKTPEAVPHMLSALDKLHAPSARLVVVGEGGGLLRAAWSVAWPDLVILPGTSRWLSAEEREAYAVETGPAAFLCFGTRCLPPAHTPEELVGLLKESVRP